MADQSPRGGDLDRRSVLKSIATGGTAVAGAGAASQPSAAIPWHELYDADCTPGPTPPILDTADHVERSWWGNVYVTEGNSETNYDFAGDPIPTGQDELVIHVHGWYADRDCGIRDVNWARNGYASVDYDQPVTGLVWDSYYTWSSAKDIADINAKKLANFLTDYTAENPNTTIRLQGHSLGVRVVCETVLELYEQDECDVVTSLILLAGAVDNTAVSMEGKYGTAIENAVVHAENYWMDEDDILTYLYKPREFSRAVGADGCNGTEPANYTDHYHLLDGHGDYYKADRGVLDDVVEQFQPAEKTGCETEEEDEEEDDNCWLFCW